MATKTQLIEQLFDTMGDVVRQMTPSREAWLGELGLSRQQLAMLFIIGRQESLTVGALADCLATTSGATTQMIDHLIQKQLLSRSTDTVDRRIVHVALSPQGRQVMHEARGAHKQFLEHLLSPLSESELKTLVELISKLGQSK